MGISEIENIVEKYSDMVMRIAYQNSFNKSDSEDIVQEVFIRLIKNIEKLKTPEHLKAWLIRVTINLSKDYNKNSWNKRVDRLEENVPYFDSEEKEILCELSKLKPIYRNTIYLYYYEGYKINEIANILKLNTNTVSSNLTRARKQLGKLLKEEEGENYV